MKGIDKRVEEGREETGSGRGEFSRTRPFVRQWLARAREIRGIIYWCISSPHPRLLKGGTCECMT